MIQAAIDVGTNTILLLVAETQPLAAPTSLAKNKLVKILRSEIEYPRLGQGVHKNRAFAEESMARAQAVFKKYQGICEQLHVEKIYAVGTSASRDAKNSPEFYKKIQKETGIEVNIIPGESEARFSFLGGLLPQLDPFNSVILDIGGGSTEFVHMKSDQKIHGQSLNMGCVRATELFLQGDPYTKASLSTLEQALKKEWATLDPSLQKALKEKEWVGIAGTPTTAAAMALGLPTFTSEKIDGYRLNRCAVADLYESLAIQPEKVRESNPLIGKGRSDVMVSGLAILLTSMEVFEKEDVVVSTRGLRHGVLLSDGL